MLKIIHFFVLAIVSQNLFAQDQKINVHTEIKSVVVYRSGAVVSRMGQISLPAGRSEILVEEVAVEIEPQSIQMKIDASLTILTVGTRKNFMKEKGQVEEVARMDKQLEAVGEKIRVAQKKLEVFKQDEVMLLRNQELKSGSALIRPADIKAALDFQSSRLEETFKQQLSTEKALMDLEKEKLSIARQLQELNQQKQAAIQGIYAVVEAKKPMQSPIEVRYLVKKAGWYPTYNISVKDISSPLELQFNANLYQSSGELWKNVKVSLSSGNPGENNVKPNIEPWYLHYIDKRINLTYHPAFSDGAMLFGRVVDNKGMPIAGATVLAKGTTTGTSTDASGTFRLNGNLHSGDLIISAVGFKSKTVNAQKGFLTISLEEQINALEEVVVTGYSTAVANDENAIIRLRGLSTLADKSDGVTVTTIYQPVTIRYDVEEPLTVLPDGKLNMINIKQRIIDATYAYYAAPKLEPAAYLAARISNWQKLDLLPGEVSLFYEGTYLGKSFIDPSISEDTLQVSLGKDEGVVVKRILVKEYSTKKLLGNDKTENRIFEWSVRNNKQQPISIVVEDQYPISTMKEIEVNLQRDEGGALDETTKLISWKIMVAAGAEIKQQIKYSVRYPKEKQIQLD